MRHEKKQESVTLPQGKKKWAIETVIERTPILDLSDKDFKVL